MIADPELRFSGLPILTEYLDGQTWRLVREVSYRTEAGPTSTIRGGFHFDFASVPRVFWRLFPPTGLRGQPYGIAALVHDWLYVHQAIAGVRIDRQTADRVFLEILIYVGCHRLTRRLMYMAVRVGGGRYWRRNARSAVECPYGVQTEWGAA
jgi:hypothetical protein